MTRPPKLATPLTALAVAVVLPLAKVPLLSVSVTVDVSPVTVLLLASCTAAAIGGLRAVPNTPFGGCCVKASFVGVWMVKEFEVALVKLPSVAFRV